MTEDERVLGIGIGRWEDRGEINAAFDGASFFEEQDEWAVCQGGGLDETMRFVHHAAIGKYVDECGRLFKIIQDPSHTDNQERLVIKGTGEGGNLLVA